MDKDDKAESENNDNTKKVELFDTQSMRERGKKIKVSKEGTAAEGEEENNDMVLALTAIRGSVAVHAIAVAAAVLLFCCFVLEVVSVGEG